MYEHFALRIHFSVKAVTGILMGAVSNVSCWNLQKKVHIEFSAFENRIKSRKLNLKLAIECKKKEDI